MLMKHLTDRSIDEFTGLTFLLRNSALYHLHVHDVPGTLLLWNLKYSIIMELKCNYDYMYMYVVMWQFLWI